MRPGRGSPGAILPNGDSQKMGMVKAGKGHQALRADMKARHFHGRETFPLCKHTTGGSAFSREEGGYFENLSFLEFGHAHSFIYFCLC